jgi:hypothetical protein
MLQSEDSRLEYEPTGMRVWVRDFIQLMSFMSVQWIIEEGEVGYRIKSAASDTYIGYSLGETLGDLSYVTGNDHPVEYEIEGDPVTRYKYVYPLNQ